MPEVKVGGTSIHYDVYGAGETVVLISGFGSNSRGWFLEIPTFSPEFQVVTMDNRGTGRSDKPDIPYTMEMLAGDVVAVLDDVGADAAHAYGVSMGGMIAQELALRYPDRVISLVLGCTSCGGSHSARPGAEVAEFLFDTERMRQLTPEQGARESFPFLFSQEFIDSNPELMDQFVAQRTKEVTPLRTYARQGQAIAGHDTYDRLRDIKVPTLVIAGTADRLVPVENSRILASRIPNAKLVLLEGMGHGYHRRGGRGSQQGDSQFLPAAPPALAGRP
ncbi:MAG: alpha/beta fold hydrolase [Chloroflexota bacterium]